MQPRLRGPQRDPQGRRDRRQWEVEVVMKDDHGSHLRLQPEEAAFELVAVGDRRFEAVDRRGASSVE